MELIHKLKMRTFLYIAQSWKWWRNETICDCWCDGTEKRGRARYRDRSSRMPKFWRDVCRPHKKTLLCSCCHLPNLRRCCFALGITSNADTGSSIFSSFSNFWNFFIGLSTHHMFQQWRRRLLNRTSSYLLPFVLAAMRTTARMRSNSLPIGQ